MSDEPQVVVICTGIDVASDHLDMAEGPFVCARCGTALAMTKTTYTGARARALEEGSKSGVLRTLCLKCGAREVRREGIEVEMLPETAAELVEKADWTPNKLDMVRSREWLDRQA